MESRRLKSTKSSGEVRKVHSGSATSAYVVGTINGHLCASLTVKSQCQYCDVTEVWT